ncbi:hypothetical protein LTR75_001903 [Friedmanniomyces endolithicus]|nr:hypothetical protein LTR75_001903 [Friedmanniomyces endolithicus]
MATGGASTHHFNASKLFDASGYVCVITGGGTGIGLMAAQSLAANGARVYILGRRMEALEKAAKSHHDPSGVSEMLFVHVGIVRRHHGLDVVLGKLRTRWRHVVWTLGRATPSASLELIAARGNGRVFGAPVSGPAENSEL